MNIQSSTPIKTAAAIEHLKALGYTETDKIYYRAIGPSTRKIEGIGFNIPSELKSLNSSHGIYFVVNGGGHSDKDIATGRALFYEHDDLPKDLQLNLWQSLGLPEPTFQVDTGGKSIHSYWVFEQPIEVAAWKFLQSDLLEYANADRTIKNPSRIMRLAGFTHQKTGEMSTMVSNSGKRYGFDELRSVIATQAPKAVPARASQPIEWPMGDMPLEKCLAKSNRDLIQSGAGEGGRNASGFTLAADLIGTEKHLRNVGQRFEGDARSLFDDYCQRCSPALTGNEVEAIWKSAEKSSNGPCLDEDKIRGCIDAWYRTPKSSQSVPLSRSSSTVKLELAHTDSPPRSKPIAVDVTAEALKIVDAELPFAEELARIQDLAKASGFQSNDIKGRVTALKMERVAAEDRLQAAQGLPSLLAERNRRLDLKDFLWGDSGKLASMFHQRAIEMKMPVEHSFTAFIPTSANFIPPGVEVLVQEGFEQPLIFNSMILGTTGDGKSHALKVALAPAEAIEKTNREQYEDALKRFEEDLEAWENDHGENRGRKPEKPICDRRVYQNGTREALMRLHSIQPKGLLWAKDEGEGFAASQNQYRSGKGDDVQQGLEDFNGGSYSKDLVTDSSSYYIPNRKIQKLGTMHTTQLMKQLEADNFTDYRGDIARWLFCAVPFGERKLDLQRDTSPKINKVLSGTLKALYEDLETLERHEDGYMFDDGAYAIYAAYQHQLRDWCKAEVGSLSAAFPKMEQYCTRLAGWLHIVNAKLANHQPKPMIDSRTMCAAIALTDFYIGQLRLIYASAVPGQAMTGLMLEVQQFCQGKDKAMTAGQIRIGSRSLKAKTDISTMKQIIAQLAKSGYGQMDGDRYMAFPDPEEPEYVFEIEYVE